MFETDNKPIVDNYQNHTVPLSAGLWELNHTKYCSSAADILYLYLEVFTHNTLTPIA